MSQTKEEAYALIEYNRRRCRTIEAELELKELQDLMDRLYPKTKKLKLVVKDWGFSFGKFYNGGGPGVSVAWQWQLTFYWKWRGWWYNRCFYGRPHELGITCEQS